jgi:hypothetical protein
MILALWGVGTIQEVVADQALHIAVVGEDISMVADKVTAKINHSIGLKAAPNTPIHAETGMLVCLKYVLPQSVHSSSGIVTLAALEP